ncbi:P450 monooxygenase-like protein [Epichloe bromicola]
MVTKSRLRMALAAEKGIDYKKLKQQKKHKEHLKRKNSTSQLGGAPLHGDENDENEDKGQNRLNDDLEEEVKNDDEVEDEGLNFCAVDETDTSDSEIEMEEKIERRSAKNDRKFNSTKSKQDEEEEEEEEEEDEEDEEDIPVSDLEDLDDEDKEDLIPHARLTINNTSALLAALDRISIPKDQRTTFASHQSVSSSVNTAESIPDVSDDLQRELAFYSQCLEAAKAGRAKLLAEGVPFSRPKDYFAEMIKEDAHMEKVKAKLIEEASAKKASAEARKLRDLKKFGKQVQVAKLQERQKAKRETLEKIKNLKRKRHESGGDMTTNEADIFDVSVDNELAKHSQRSGPPGRGGSSSGPGAKRQKKNEKYGFGGKKRHAKSGDAISSGDLSGFNTKRMKAGAKTKSRPGKNRRKAMASK